MMKEAKKQGLKQLGILIVGLIALNVFGNYFFKRIPFNGRQALYFI